MSKTSRLAERKTPLPNVLLFSQQPCVPSRLCGRGVFCYDEALKRSMAAFTATGNGGSRSYYIIGGSLAPTTTNLWLYFYTYPTYTYPRSLQMQQQDAHTIHRQASSSPPTTNTNTKRRYGGGRTPPKVLHLLGRCPTGGSSD